MIEQAIRTRTPLTFQYIRPEKTPGFRTGNPHAAYIRRKKNGEEHAYLHLWQTEGVTDSVDEVLPGWRQFFINNIVDPTLASHGAPFDVAPGYNPASYEHPIAKI